jgi:hypothetical protein
MQQPIASPFWSIFSQRPESRLPPPMSSDISIRDVLALARNAFQTDHEYLTNQPRRNLPVGEGRQSFLVPSISLEHAGFMPPTLHGVIREGRRPFSATGSKSLPASGGYGLSAEAQLHGYASMSNIQGGRRGFCPIRVDLAGCNLRDSAWILERRLNISLASLGQSIHVPAKS